MAPGWSGVPGDLGHDLREAFYRAMCQRGTAAVFTALTMSSGKMRPSKSLSKRPVAGVNSLSLSMTLVGAGMGGLLIVRFGILPILLIGAEHLLPAAALDWLEPRAIAALAALQLGHAQAQRVHPGHRAFAQGFAGAPLPACWPRRVMALPGFSRVVGWISKAALIPVCQRWAACWGLRCFCCRCLY